MQWGRGQGPFWKDSGRGPGCRAASPPHSSDQSPRCQPSRGPDAGGETLTWAPQGGSAWGALPTPSSLRFILGLASSSHGKGRGRPRPVTLTGWTQTRLQNTGPFEGDGQTSWSPGRARPSSLPGEGLRGSGAALPPFFRAGNPVWVSPASCYVWPLALPGETHTHTPTGVHTHLGAHGRSPFTQSHRGLQFWGAHPSALPWGAAGPSPCPFVSSPLGAVCVPVGVLGCIYACVCMTRVTPQPARSRTGVRCPYPPQKQTSLGLGSQHLGL